MMIRGNIVDTSLSPTISDVVPHLNFVLYPFTDTISQHTHILVQCTMVNSAQGDVFLLQWIRANSEGIVPIHDQINPTKYGLGQWRNLALK